MKKLILVFLALLLNNAWALEPKPFTTDYCTAYPEGTREKPDLWKHCCLLHDLFFWAGGSLTERNDADLTLKYCVAETGELKQAELIYWAVRMGGQSPVHIPSKKWGNGWPLRPPYSSLNKEEVQAIENELLKDYPFITPTLKAQFLMSLWSRME